MITSQDKLAILTIQSQRLSAVSKVADSHSLLSLPTALQEIVYRDLALALADNYDANQEMDKHFDL